jgi:5'-phosphate synthase pdxT subunit
VPGKLVGVLAIQGDYAQHARSIEKAGGAAFEARTAADLDRAAGLIIPGGESTTILKLLKEEGLWEPLRAFGHAKPIFGTCAGAILIAREVTHPVQDSLNLVDIGVERNAYGRQIDSRIVPLETALGPLEAVFIRAPIIRRTGPGVEVLACYQGDPVLIREGKHLVATFHPELTADPRVHARFLEGLC